MGEVMNKPFLVIRRHPYEEPYHTQLEIFASNGRFRAETDIYCNVEDLDQIGKALEVFPRKIGDEYRYEYGSDDPAKRQYRYFLLRAYTIGYLGHCALQIAINSNKSEPNEGVCRFSIKSEPVSINQLGDHFRRFAKLEHLEISWTPEGSNIFAEYQLAELH